MERIQTNLHDVTLLQASDEQIDVFLHPNHNIAQLTADIYMRGSRILNGIRTANGIRTGRAQRIQGCGA